MMLWPAAMTTEEKLEKALSALRLADAQFRVLMDIHGIKYSGTETEKKITEAMETDSE